MFTCAGSQLSDASAHAMARRVVLKGDLPIGVCRSSVDAWVYPHLFNLDKQVGVRARVCGRGVRGGCGEGVRGAGCAGGAGVCAGEAVREGVRARVCGERGRCVGGWVRLR